MLVLRGETGRVAFPAILLERDQALALISNRSGNILTSLVTIEKKAGEEYGEGVMETEITKQFFPSHDLMLCLPFLWFPGTPLMGRRSY